MLPEKSFDTGGVVINFAEGPKSGPPLLLLHGLTDWWHRWESLLPHFAAWHVYACDFRGHGRSGRVEDRYRLVDYAQDIVVLLRKQITAPSVLIGHSLGAATALVVASQAPDRVRALVVLDPPLFARNASLDTKPEAKTWFSWVYETMKSAPSYEQVLARCREMSPDSDEAAIKYFADNIYAVDPGTVRITLQNRLFAGVNWESVLQTVTCPTLLLRGDWDHGAVMREEDADFVQAKLPHAVNVKIPKGTHMFPWEKTDITMEHIQPFLRSV